MWAPDSWSGETEGNQVRWSLSTLRASRCKGRIVFEDGPSFIGGRVNRRRWVASALVLVAGASLAYLQPWQPRLLVLRQGGQGPPDLMLLHGEGSSPADFLRANRRADLAAQTLPLPPSSHASDAATALPLNLATRVPAVATSPGRPRATGLIVGERWGCASFETGKGPGYQCWEAGPAPQARHVPWMDGRQFRAAPDHLCSQAIPDLAWRCWHRPVPGEVSGRPLPGAWQWLNPHGARWGESYSRADRVGGIDMGGTFACLHTIKDDGVFCVGDDRFGQLGSSAPPRPDAGPGDPAFLAGVWPAEYTALGTWHGCAFAAPDGMDRGGHIACWGRGDHGQLGAPAPERCRAGGRDIACARKPIQGVSVASGDSSLALGAGDLFTCLADRQGIRCWGATRDAIFGVPGSCPESLRRAWPTLHGTVLAPRAACSDKPVPLDGATAERSRYFQVHPRAVCFHRAGGYACLGAVPDPRGMSLAAATISPGSDASACTLSDGSVMCWGEAYSPPPAYDLPVLVALEAVAPIGETAVVRFGEASSWEDPGCLARRSCTLAAAPLPRCPRGAADAGAAGSIPRWSELLPRAAAFSGKTVRLRGPLAVGSISTSAALCRTKSGKPACCNETGGPVLIGGAPQPLGLQGFHCRGDDSQVCCNAPAYGQEVVASGRLTPLSYAFGARDPWWSLTEVKLCSE